MRILYPIVFVMFGTLWVQSSCEGATRSCNQRVYDHVYTELVKQVLNIKHPTQQDIDNKNTAIENLRALCRGQLSSYETGRKVNESYKRTRRH